MKTPTGGHRIYFEGNHGFLADKDPFVHPSRTCVGCPGNHTRRVFAMHIRELSSEEQDQCVVGFCWQLRGLHCLRILSAVHKALCMIHTSQLFRQGLDSV